MDIRRATITSYDPATHTASVSLWDAGDMDLPGIPVAHSVPWWQCLPGCLAGVLFFDETNPTDACIAFVFGGRPPLDPHFDPSLGHRHRGIEDDAPEL